MSRSKDWIKWLFFDMNETAICINFEIFHCQTPDIIVGLNAYRCEIRNRSIDAYEYDDMVVGCNFNNSILIFKI